MAMCLEESLQLTNKGIGEPELGSPMSAFASVPQRWRCGQQRRDWQMYFATRARPAIALRNALTGKVPEAAAADASDLRGASVTAALCGPITIASEGAGSRVRFE